MLQVALFLLLLVAPLLGGLYWLIFVAPKFPVHKGDFTSVYDNTINTGNARELTEFFRPEEDLEDIPVMLEIQRWVLENRETAREKLFEENVTAALDRQAIATSLRIMAAFKDYKSDAAEGLPSDKLA